VLAIINNHGGGIFRMLPRLETMSPRAAGCLANTHRADLSGFATLWGMSHLRVRTADDLDALESCGNNLLLEVIPDAEQTAAFWKDWDRIAP
jgi:2-succinyl-5-enolpyruvyl-6-hydroxy-3-cyclohexene-1-carboxylate synthase